MPQELRFSEKYAPLQGLRTRYAIIAGGRGSGKSFAVSTFLLSRVLRERDITVLFTRYTLTNAEVSVLPEFTDKIERGGLSGYFEKSGNDLTCTATNSKILFRGIKTSNGINTAALKSIPNLAIWVNDESEELTDERTFDTIDLSIRKSGVHCEVWLVLNPSDVSHFIYRRFFALYGIEDVFNGVSEDVTYIHTTYKDNPYLPNDFIQKAEKCAKLDANKYNNIWLGRWNRKKDGLIYSNWRAGAFPESVPSIWYGVDWGFTNDPTAIVRITYFHGVIYCKEILYRRGVSVGGVYDIRSGKLLEMGVKDYIKEDAKAYGADSRRTPVFCDPARPEHISELIRWDIPARRADNRDKTGRIEYLKYFPVVYEGDDIRKEQSAYSWLPDKLDKTKYTNIPQDGDDHLMDAINYGAVTLLRMQNVLNEIGEK